MFCSGADPALFSQGLTAYHDIALDKCYVIELNTTIVMPPRNLWELLINVKVANLKFYDGAKLRCLHVGETGGPSQLRPVRPSIGKTLKTPRSKSIIKPIFISSF